MTRLNELLDWYAKLTPESLAQVPAFYADAAYFKDPFNEVRGVVPIQAIFSHMFATTEDPRFVFDTRIEQGQQAFVTWQFLFSLNGKAYTVTGSSHLVFDDQGLVTLHRDYWDAAEELFQKLPVIGAPVRWLRGLFRLKQT